MSPDKEKEKEAARAAKAAKFAAKQAKAAAGAQQQGQGLTASASASASASAGAGPGTAPARPSKAQAPALPPYVDQTPAGEKKLVQPLDHDHFKAYNPQAVESAWYAWWEKSGFFQPRPGAGPDKFVIPLPPPNVTGALHCGHALANSLQDTLIRWHRMRGFSTLWVPGCDHAGIATQSVVEKMLWKQERKTRHDLGRTEFTRVVWEWKEEYHQRINRVQRLMGGSMDWTREAFSMDERRTAATTEAFCRLHEEGYIYRSDRLVNWCSSLQTALSTLEVENRDINGRTMLDVPGYDKKIEFGIMTYFNYPIDGCAAATTIPVATTRPETLFGDTGIAVHPDDKRYAHLVGKFARHPFTDRLLKIVADTYADPELGTGAVKLTPAHDPKDYQVGQRHGLDLINILNDDGTLNANAGPRFAGKRRFDARYAVVEELTKLGLFVKKESHAMKIPLCEKTKDVIEPRMKKQWWVKMQGMAEEALRVVEDGQITIKPESAHRSYQRWMSSITDWCISRQLWWGHRIPAYRVISEATDGADRADGADGADGADASAEHDETIWVVGRTPEEAQARAEAKLPAGQPFRLERDPDCLDTWFSSGLWPLSTLGWPEIEGRDFKTFFPTSLLETGWDILFFWVARMIMLSVKLTGQVPFTEVYCHSLIRDSEGRKMSKSLGNVIDPVDVISGIDLEALHAKLLVGNLKEDEVARATKYQKTAFPNGIPECGADALRFTLLSYATGGGDINFDINVMAAYRRFCNKIWQATKYVLGRLPAEFAPAGAADGGAGARLLSLPEKWILHRMNEAVRGINDALAGREFSRSTQFAYQFFYDELCDVFIENSKGLLSDGSAEEQRESVQQTLYQALDVALRLLHPLMPFITEELWQRLPRGGQGPESVMLAPYPTFDPGLDFAAEAADYELGLRCAGAARSLASDFNMRTGGHVLIRASTEGAHAKIAAQLGSIQTLCGKTIGKVELLSGGSGGGGAEPGGCAVHVVSADVVVFLAVADLIKDVEAEIKKIQTKLDKTRAAVAKQQQLIAKDGFEDKTSDSVRAAERKKLEDAQAAVGNYERTIFEFAKLRIDS